MKKPSDRREFLASAGGAAIAAGLLSSTGSGNADAAEPQADQQKGKKMKIEVNHEWGTLKEVVVGIPHVYVPDPMPALISKLKVQ